MITTAYQNMLYKGIAMFMLFLSVAIIVAGIILIHELPYKIAKRRGHPQQDAIRCRAVMGLILFPLWLLAMVWAYMRSGVSYFGGKYKNDDESSSDDIGSVTDFENESVTDGLDNVTEDIEIKDIIDSAEPDENETEDELNSSNDESLINKSENIGS